MFNVFYFCLALSFCMLYVKSEAPAYTWVDYDGKNIPANAFSITDDEEKPVYIGMGKYEKENTNCTGDLFEGATEITVQCYGDRKLKNNLKILTVEDKTQWKWVKTSYENWFQSNYQPSEADFEVEDLVLSNYAEQKNRIDYIGRTKLDNGTIVSGHGHNGLFFFISNGQQDMKNENYEVLVHKKEEAAKPEDSPKKSCAQLLDEVKATAAGSEANMLSATASQAKDVKEATRTTNTI